MPPKMPPPGILRKAADTALCMFRSGVVDPLDHSVYKRFFSSLYWKVNSLDSEGIIALLKPDLPEIGIQFRTASTKFRLIDDKAQKTVLVRYGEGDRLISTLRAKGPERWLLRKLQRYAVNVYSGDFIKMMEQGAVEEITPGVYAVTTRIQYDDNIGLLIDEIPDDPEAFIL